jgi:hypothetical protein
MTSDTDCGGAGRAKPNARTDTIETLFSKARHRAAKLGGEIPDRCSAAPADDSGE